MSGMHLPTAVGLDVCCACTAEIKKHNLLYRTYAYCGNRQEQGFVEQVGGCAAISFPQSSVCTQRQPALACQHGNACCMRCQPNTPVRLYLLLY